MWLHAASDGAMALAFILIPIALLVFAYRRKDLAYRSVFVLLALVLLACSALHGIEALAPWHPVPRLASVLGGLTAALSLGTAFVLWRIVPKALALPNPRELERTNRRLKEEIYAREQAEEQALRINSELEARVEERTRELARSNGELEQFAYVASHDLREPLRMVASYTQLLARRYQGRLDPTADEFIGYAVEGCERMRELIHDLLEYSRVERAHGSAERVDTERALHEALRNLAVAIDESGARVTYDALPALFATHSQVVQLLQNLIDNSIKYRSDAPPQIHVGVEHKGTEVILRVRDNGAGFEQKYAERIFGMFQRLHARGTYPGTGMGLALCRKIMETHQGRIWAESKPGEGATFYCAFPVAPRGDAT
jgi:light-regulated signal transduction histidine kinase (bacteriophytochrome)